MCEHSSIVAGTFSSKKLNASPASTWAESGQWKCHEQSTEESTMAKELTMQETTKKQVQDSQQKVLTCTYFL